MNILVVCLGNICRSPLAEGLIQREINQRGLDWQVDSAGTSAWHSGEHPDSRSIEVANKHGVDISRQRARQIKQKDFSKFDLILTMDESNRQNVLSLAQSEEDRAKVAAILPFSGQVSWGVEVPDPYWDDNGFEQVYRMLEEAARSTVDRLQKNNSQLIKPLG